MEMNKKNEKQIAELQYQLQRNKSMRNGVACQRLNQLIQKLIATQQPA